MVFERFFFEKENFVFKTILHFDTCYVTGKICLSWRKSATFEPPFSLKKSQEFLAKMPVFFYLLYLEHKDSIFVEIKPVITIESAVLVFVLEFLW